MKKGIIFVFCFIIFSFSFSLFTFNAYTLDGFKTSYSYSNDFPTYQGENGFTMLAGDDLSALVSAPAQFVEGVQWNVGGTNFAVLNKGFMMPNLRKYAAFKWKAPHSGIYDLY